MNYADRDLFADLISDLNTLTTIAQANVITKDVKAMAVGESRPAAVLFLDIVNYSELTNKLTTERLSMLIDRIFQIFLLSVKAYGGYCDKVIGDAGLYVFTGHPAHPPAIEGALRAGLVILERSDQLRFSLEPQGIDFNVRIGVAFGEVTRERVGGNESQFTVMGNTINLAQRLEACAEPATIQVLPDIVDAVGDLFTFEKIGKKELKNIGKFSVYKVSKLNERKYQFRTSGAYLSRFVGRDVEFKKAVNIIDNWLKVSYDSETFDITKIIKRPEKRNRLLVIRGAMALGKSRMAFELLQHYIRSCNAHTTTAHCLTNNSLDLFGAELMRVAGITPDNLPDRWEQLCAYAETTISKSYADRQRSHLPLIAMLINCPRVNTDKIRMIDAQSFVIAVQLAFSAACELIAHFTHRPVIITIEDIQWLSSYEDLLINILNSASLPQPLIVIATARPEYEHKTGLFENACEFNEILLQPISSVNGRAIVESILPGLELNPASWQQIDDKAAGIPYYFEEFARMLVHRGYVVETEGKFKLIRELTEIELPTDIQMLILGKLDQLEPKLKLLVSKASVLGRAFIAKILIEIESKLSDGEPEKLLEMLLKLVANEILTRELDRTTGVLPVESADSDSSLLRRDVTSQEFGTSGRVVEDNFSLLHGRDSRGTIDDKYFFKHIVTQESAYKAMLERNKWLLHSLAADIFEKMIVPGSKLEKEMLISLIMHLEFLERYLNAHKSCCQLLRLLAYTGQYKDWDIWEARALRNWYKAKERDSSLPDESPWWIDDAIGTRLWRTGKYPEALALFEKALVYHRKTGDKHREGIALNSIGIVLNCQGQIEQAMEYYEQSLKISREIDDRRGVGATLNNIGLIYRHLGKFELAKQYLDQALSIYHEIGDQRGESNALNCIGILHSNQERYDLAMEYYEQSLTIKREVGERSGQGIVLNCIGQVYSIKGQFAMAMNYFEQSLTIKREVNDRRGEGYTLNCIGQSYSDQKKYNLAMQYYEQSLQITREVGDIQGELYLIGAITNLMTLVKDCSKAKVYCNEGLKLAKDSNNKYSQAKFLFELALITALEGKTKKAKTQFQKANEIVQEDTFNMDSELDQLITKVKNSIDNLSMVCK